MDRKRIDRALIRSTEKPEQADFTVWIVKAGLYIFAHFKRLFFSNFPWYSQINLPGSCVCFMF